MSSVVARTKQAPVNSGFYVTLGAISTVSYSLSGTEVAPAFAPLSVANFGATGALDKLGAAGAILRDEGKTLRSANRIFRKVQLLLSTGSILASGTDGVSGVAASATVTSPFLTFYVELPGAGVGGQAGNVAGNFANIARLG